MQRDSGPQSTTWTPPMWMIRVAVILLMAWYVSRQIPPEKQRGAAPAPEQNASFEPAIPVSPGPSETTARNPVVEPDATDNPQIGEASESIVQSTPPGVVEAVTPADTSDKATSKSAKTGTKQPLSKASPSTAKPREADSLIISNVTIKDQSGKVVYKGEIDLHPTFDRIARGEKFPHRNDGSTFRNLEGRLPKKPAGYYTEYVHPTKGINGPGPQRIVIGKEGEAYYTHDHYDSFRKVRE